jgi:hypothetical protein
LSGSPHAAYDQQRNLRNIEAKKGNTRSSLLKKHGATDEEDVFINDYSEKNSTRN